MDSPSLDPRHRLHVTVAGRPDVPLHLGTGTVCSHIRAGSCVASAEKDQVPGVAMAVAALLGGAGPLCHCPRALSVWGLWVGMSWASLSARHTGAPHTH